MIRAPLLVLVVLAVFACGHAQPAASIPDLETRRDRILELEQGIAAASEQLGAASAVCADVCRLADDICRASEDICRIAGDMPDDAWARGRCESGTASCRDARARCATCRP